MDFDVELMDADFSPGVDDGVNFSSSEDLSVSEPIQIEVLDTSDPSEISENFSSDDMEASEAIESGEAQTYSEIVVYDDTLLLEKLDVLHQDALLLFLILIVTFARSCFHSYRDKLIRSDRAVRR